MLHNAALRNFNEILPCPSSTVQSLKFAPCPDKYLICAGTWDNKATIWEIDSAQGSLKSEAIGSAPMLCVAWAPDSSHVFLGGCSNSLDLWDLNTNNLVRIGLHASPIREVVWSTELNVAITGSWDSSINLWDMNQPNPVHRIPLPGRVFCMGYSYPLLVAGLSDHRYAVWNVAQLRHNFQPEIVKEASYQSQIRSISCSYDAKRFAVGHAEGKCSLRKISCDPNLKADFDFAFKCHRDEYAHVVNAVTFNPRSSLLATGGSDCSAVIWDYMSRTKLVNCGGLGAPVTALDFSADGRLLACGLGYDWHKGIELAGRFFNKIIVRDVSSIKASQ
eukprot:CAMPEP_0204915472 /NCGR_PEP_ID=MMETSP1397-20131031/13462_1 /ASSEMBLY_ACC=CAM_ASM_000891 /TAXON_ID=49980 /ORGANISM="Climacostomum Climacostomum virens, Strain Stock W-24" /LENGTH=332 /DNA_ID=CAMNT_0052087525 /DNA_START=221 /DNA_END=1216 /DNA_ORIENTATION=+